MALNLQNKYPGRFDPASADYPQGKFKNRSSPTSQDGSYMERDWLNDWAGFFGALLGGGGLSPNGNVDTAQSSQFYNALLNIILKSLPKRTFASSDYIRIPDTPGGLIIQWGSTPPVPSGSNALVTYPVAYPNRALCVVTTVGGTNNMTSQISCAVNLLSNSTFLCYSYTTIIGPSFYYLSVGY